MKKKLLLLFILFIPVRVYASDFFITCDKGPFKSNTVFNCQLKAAKAHTYKEISATVKDTVNLSCSTPVIGEGLEEVEMTDNSFKAKGQEVTGVIAAFSCQVKELRNDTTDQIEIDDLTYTIESTGKEEKEQVEVIRSSKLELKKIEVDEIKDNKPRDVSVKESLLSSLSSPQLEFVFSSYLTKYEKEVTNGVTHIDVNYTTMVEGATVEVQGDVDLKEGLNVIDLYVTSPDGGHKTCYTLYVTRLKEGEDIYYSEQDSTLKSLKIKGKSIGFDINKYTYDLHLKADEDKIEVETVANNKDAVVDIDKTSGLKNGDIITVTVTSVDGLNKTKYTIRVHKDAPKKNYTPAIIITGVVLAIIGVFVGVVKTTNRKAPDVPTQPEIPNETEAQVDPTKPVSFAQPTQPQAVEQPQVVEQPTQPVDTSNNTNS